MNLEHPEQARPDLYTAEHLAYRNAVRQFVAQEIEPRTDEIHALGTIPRDLWERMGDLGMLGTSHPAEYGGGEADILYATIATEELTRTTCSGVYNAYVDHAHIASIYLHDAPEATRTRLLPEVIAGRAICAIAITEPGCGSDVAGITTTARRDGDEWVLSGTKAYITNGLCADAIIVAARTNQAANAHRGISLFLVEGGTAGLTRGANLEKLGSHATDTAYLYFDDCRLSADHLIGTVDDGFPLLMANLNLERLLAASSYLGAVQQMLRLTVDYTAGRTVFGKPVSAYQVNRHQLVDLHTELAMARAFFHECCSRHIAGEDIPTETSMLKYVSGELANKAAYQCLTLHGGHGYFTESPIAHWLGDARLFTLGGGTTTIMKEVIAKRIGLP